MPVKDVFLPLMREPSAPALAAIEACVALVADLGARVTALAVGDDAPSRPKVQSWPDLGDAAELDRSLVSDAQQLLNAFGNAACRLGVRADDAIVMGAYHHSRLNETVWGGVTKTVIGAPPCWVMMSH